jgi:hypothetical protein
MTVDGSPESGITKLVEDTQLPTTQQGRHTHPRHHAFTPSFKLLIIVNEYVHINSF